MLELETEGALNVAEEIPSAVTIFVTRSASRSSSAGCASGRRRAQARSGSGSTSRESQLTQAGSFGHVVANDELERAVEELAGIVRGELAAAGTMPGS